MDFETVTQNFFGFNIYETTFNSVNVTTIMSDVMENITNVTIEMSGNGTAAMQRSWIYWVPGPVICVFGMLCNILNLCILSSRVLKESPYVYLTALAISDFNLLGLAFGHLVMSNLEQSYFKAFYDCYLFFALCNVFFNVSVWVIVFMTIERMLFVIWPLKMRSSRRKARRGIVLAFIVCTMINIPRFFCYKVGKFNGAYYPYRTKFMESQIYFYISCFHAVIINFIPLSMLTVTNTVLLRALYKAGKSRSLLNACQQECPSGKEQTRLTRTLIAVVILFIITTTPSAFVEDPISFALFGKGMAWYEFLRSQSNQLFIYISNLLLFLNSSLNFILYCAFNRKFRKAMKSRFLWLVGRLRNKHTTSFQSAKTMTTRATLPYNSGCKILKTRATSPL